VAFEGGSEVAPAARAAGYTVETLVVMTLDPDVDQPPRPDVDVREIDRLKTERQRHDLNLHAGDVTPSGSSVTMRERDRAALWLL